MIRVEVKISDDDIWEADFENERAADAWIEANQASGLWAKLPGQWVKTLIKGQDATVQAVRFVRSGFKLIPEFQVPGAVKKTDITKIITSKRALNAKMKMRELGEQCAAKLWLAIESNCTSESQLKAAFNDTGINVIDRMLTSGMIVIAREALSALHSQLISGDQIADILDWIDQSDFTHFD